MISEEELKYTVEPSGKDIVLNSPFPVAIICVETASPVLQNQTEATSIQNKKETAAYPYLLRIILVFLKFNRQAILFQESFISQFPTFAFTSFQQ